MIVVKLSGGLGNQLFQFATAQQAARRRSVPLQLDTRWFDTQTKRQFQLREVGITAELTDESLARRLPPAEWTGAGRRLQLAYRHRIRQLGMRLVVERTPGRYDDRIVRVPANAYVVGYWQSERYFVEDSAFLREHIRPTAPFGRRADTIRDEITACSHPVSLHVRRGDYISDRETSRVHGSCGLAYYTTAMRCLQERSPDAEFFVFSDDPAWCRDRLRQPSVHVVSSEEDPITDIEELFLMRECRSHIVANSSFSWWAAWLAGNRDGQVIAPRQWFADPQRSSVDVVPTWWSRL